MDAQTISTLVSSVGFPILSFFILVVGIKYVYDQESEKHEKLEKRQEDLSQSIVKLTEAQNKTSEVLSQLVEKIGGIK